MADFNDNEIKEYAIGFNQGYEFASALPSVTPKMFANMPEPVKEKPMMKGILDGIGQKHKERFLEKQRAMAPEKANTHNKDKSGPDMSPDR